MAKSNRPLRKMYQALPSSSIIPRIRFSQSLHNELTNIVEAAFIKHHGVSQGRDGTPLNVIMASVEAEKAIARFVSTQHHEKSLPDFRELVDVTKSKSLPALIKKLIDALPTDEHVPMSQLRALYCYDDPESNGINSSESANELTERMRREDRWEAQLSARAIMAILEQWIELFAELKSRAGGTGATVKVAQQQFVAELAAYWHQELKLPLGNSRSGAKRDGQDGYFARFVRAAAEVIPEGFGSSSWEHSIRQVSSANKTLKIKG